MAQMKMTRIHFRARKVPLVKTAKKKQMKKVILVHLNLKL